MLLMVVLSHRQKAEQQAEGENGEPDSGLRSLLRPLKRSPALKQALNMGSRLDGRGHRGLSHPAFCSALQEPRGPVCTCMCRYGKLGGNLPQGNAWWGRGPYAQEP